MKAPTTFNPAFYHDPAKPMIAFPAPFLALFEWVGLPPKPVPFVNPYTFRI